MVRRVLAIALAAPWVVWALARTLGLDVVHPLVAAMTYTPYVAASSPLPVLAALILRRRVVAAVAAVAAAALVFAIAPRAVADRQPRAGGPKLTVMTVNLFVGRGDAKAVMALVERYDVDVLSLQELTPGELARIDAAGATSLLPGRSEAPREGASGSALLARRPLLPVASRDPGPHAEPEARLSVPGAPPLLLKAVHPAPPLRRASEAQWERVLAALPSAADGEIRILAGDFNATLDHRALRGVLDRGYADAAARAGAGLRPTWPALPRRSLPITLDHVLVDRRVKVDGVHVERLPGSDHRAVIAQLTLPRQRADVAVAQQQVDQAAAGGALGGRIADAESMTHRP